MNTTIGAHEFLAACAVAPEVLELRPDYRALLLIAEGIAADAPSALSDELVSAAEAHARTVLSDSKAEQLPHIAAWREAYRAFGAKPQRTRNSLEALMRRADKGLPRVNALTDIYNAISILHGLPVGGEDLSRYAGPARLVRATGEEPFETVAGGEPITEHPEPGEVIWCDDAGVTCRRWNWRQGRRTALSPQTTSAFFILDALEPLDDAGLEEAARALAEALGSLGDEVSVHQRLIAGA